MSSAAFSMQHLTKLETEQWDKLADEIYESLRPTLLPQLAAAAKARGYTPNPRVLVNASGTKIRGAIGDERASWAPDPIHTAIFPDVTIEIWADEDLELFNEMAPKMCRRIFEVKP